MKTILAVLALSLLAGCSTLTGVVDRGAEANDTLADGAEITTCRVISIGSWTRKYGSNPERAAAWRVLCHPKVEVMP